MTTPPSSTAASSSYVLLDSGEGRKLEQVGPYRLDRPAAQAVWSPALSRTEWAKADATLTRLSGGKGQWNVKNPAMAEQWTIGVSFGSMVIRRSDFGHLGIFPEQTDHWKTLMDRTAEACKTIKPFRVLNLFAYTGGSTLACVRGGAQVTHVDASKPTVGWARENAAASGLNDAPIRWIVDDVLKFVAREARRSSRYHGIILDPPSFGRGTAGQTWKIEEDLPPLLAALRDVMDPDFRFILLSAHSDGFSPLVLENLLREMLPNGKGSFESQEMTILDQSERPLPSGCSAMVVCA